MAKGKGTGGGDVNRNVQITADMNMNVDADTTKAEKKIKKVEKKGITLDADISVDIKSIADAIKKIQNQLSHVKFGAIEKGIAAMAESANASIESIDFSKMFDGFDISKFSQDIDTMSKLIKTTMQKQSKYMYAMQSQMYKGYSKEDFTGKDRTQFIKNLNDYNENRLKLIKYNRNKQLNLADELVDKARENIGNEDWFDEKGFNAFEQQIKSLKSELKSVYDFDDFEKASNNLKTYIKEVQNSLGLKDYYDKNYAKLAKLSSEEIKDFETCAVNVKTLEDSLENLTKSAQKAKNEISSTVHEVSNLMQSFEFGDTYKGFNENSIPQKNKAKWKEAIKKKISSEKKYLSDLKLTYKRKVGDFKKNNKDSFDEKQMNQIFDTFETGSKNAKNLNELSEAVRLFKTQLAEIDSGLLDKFSKIESLNILGNSSVIESKTKLNESTRELDSLISKITIFDTKLGEIGSGANKKEITLGDTLLQSFKMLDDFSNKLNKSFDKKKNKFVIDVQVDNLDNLMSKFEVFKSFIVNMETSFQNLGTEIGKSLSSTSSAVTHTEADLGSLGGLVDSITNNFKELKRTIETIGAGLDISSGLRELQLNKATQSKDSLSARLKEENLAIENAINERLSILREEKGAYKDSIDLENIKDNKQVKSLLNTGIKNFGKPVYNSDNSAEDAISDNTLKRIKKASSFLKQFLILGGKAEQLNIEGLEDSALFKDAYAKVSNLITETNAKKNNVIKPLQDELKHVESLIELHKQLLDLKAQENTQQSADTTAYNAQILEYEKKLAVEKALLDTKREEVELTQQLNRSEREALEQKEKALKSEKANFEEKKKQLLDEAKIQTADETTKQVRESLQNEIAEATKRSKEIEENTKRQAQEILENAKKQSDEIVQNAQKQSQEMLRDMQAKSDNIKNEAEAFKQASLQEIENSKKELQSIKEQTITELEQAKKQQNELLESAEKQSKAIVEQAQQQANTIINSAKEQANQINEKSRQDAENLKKTYEEQEKALNEQLEAKKRAIAEQEEEEKKKYSALERENIAHDVKRGISDRLEGKVNIDVDSKGAVSITKEFTDATGAVTKFTDHFKDAETAIENFEYGNATGSTKLSVPFDDMVLSATEATEAAQKVKTELKDVLSSTAQVGVDQKGFIQIKDEIKDVDGNLVSVIQRFHSAEEAIENFGNTAYSTNIKIKPGKPEKPVEKNKLTVDEYNAVSKKAMTSAKRSLTRQGFKYMDVDTKRLENGISTVTAKIRDANGQWMDFVAKIDASGKIFAQQKTVINQADKLEQRYNDSNFKKLNTKQVEDATKRVESSLKWKGYDDATVKVAENGSVTITRSFKDMNGEIVKTIDYFETVNKAINNYGKTADKTSRSVSFEEKPKNELSVDEYNKIANQVKSTTKQSLINDGFKYIDVTTDRLANGLSTVSAKIKDAEGQWMNFTAKIDKDGNLFDEQKLFINDSNVISRLEKQYQKNFPNKLPVKLTPEGTEAQVNQIKSVLEQRGFTGAGVEVAENGIVTITRKIQDLNGVTKSTTLEFESMNAALYEFDTAATKIKTSIQSTLQKPIKEEPKIEKPLNQLGVDAYNKASKLAIEKAEKYFAKQGAYIKNIDSKRTTDGLSSIVATIKDAKGEWYEFSADIDKTGKFYIKQQQIINDTKKLEEDYAREHKKTLTDAEIRDNKTHVENFLENSGYKQFKVDVNQDGIVKITTEIERLNGKIETTSAEFKSAEDAINNFGKSADKINISTDNSKKHPKNKLTDTQFNKASKIAIGNVIERFEKDGNQILNIDPKQTANGLSTIVATIKTANGEWKTFTAQIDKAGNLLKSQENVISNLERIADLDKKLANANKEALTYSERLEKATRSALELEKEKAKQIAKENAAMKVAEAYDFAIERRRKESEDFAARLKNDMIRRYEGDEILKSFNEVNPKVSSFDDLFNKYKSIPGVQGMAEDVNRITVAFKELNNEIEKGDDADFEKISSQLKSLSPSIKQVSSSFEKLEKPIGNLGKIASNKTVEWMKKNTKALKEFGDALEEVARLQETATTEGELAIANNKYDMITSHAKAQGKVGLRWQDSMKGLARLTRDMFGSFSIVNRADDIVREIGRTVHEVDDALTELKMATNVSDKEANSLMETYSKMGRELKATGVDVSTAATSFLKQGETIAASQKLAHDSIVLSKVGNLSAEESTKYLTSAMKGYKVEAEGALSIVDKLSAVDMASATDVGGLAEAMSKTAVTAKDAGVEMDKLISYIATVGEVTQADMGSVGNAFKTIFTRMSNIKAGKLELVDEDGTTELLSDVELSLKNVGIDLRKTVNEYNDYDDVIESLAKKWNTLSKVQQNALAKAFAGTRQSEVFRTLMANYENVEKYIAISDKSSGFALEKFSSYQESLSGRIEGFKNAFQTLSNTFVGSEFLSGAVETGTKFLDILDGIIEKTGTLSAISGSLGIYQGIKGGG